MNIRYLLVDLGKISQKTGKVDHFLRFNFNISLLILSLFAFLKKCYGGTNFHSFPLSLEINEQRVGGCFLRFCQMLEPHEKAVSVLKLRFIKNIIRFLFLGFYANLKM